MRNGLRIAAVVFAAAGLMTPVGAQGAPAVPSTPTHGAHRPSAARVVPVPGTVNARDVGGYRTVDGKTTRWGVLYRTESLSNLPPDGVTALAGLGLGSAIDLRTAPEIQADGPDRLPAGVTTVPLAMDDNSLFAFIGQVVRSKDPAYQQAQLGDGKAAARMRGLYRGFVTNPANRAALGTAIKHVAATPLPVLFHCSAGKDRTGVLADTILRAVGVPASTSEGDYLLSNELRAATDKALRDQVKAAGYMENPDLLIPLQRVETAYLKAFRNQAVASYGSFGKFLSKGLGIDASTILQLRTKRVM
ncbi:tyrosine-protein phosphatase [Streptomyces sp. NPDC048248]|uniref:tyrosine-protein phosphatase n=1 Tax=Streptomyces sp. NPDC048248 TaxID=3365523 RepID=UPI003715F797